MKRAFVSAVAALLTSVASTGNASGLCQPTERVAFACVAGKKQVSLCATGDLEAAAGRLMYRFGQDASHVELEFGGHANPKTVGFTFDYETWAKGASRTVGFKKGQFVYLVNHAAGAFGVDGGDNEASVRVLRGEKEVANIACHEPSAIDHLYEELSRLGLRSAGAL
ncbi:hypothetical protein [Kinneretia aquatilis]|jgi:hypothetical protein|uniref:hypothetical protein n=1 Tax=Kinneretia aquatilis TaxID=2070761 RepID=UPI001495358E|nr:hypothetical protein [Paucibacter aquatile]WIV97975.1 hypothetical protein K9V56_000275 [Paucibacter aquatile]